MSCELHEGDLFGTRTWVNYAVNASCWVGVERQLLFIKNVVRGKKDRFLRSVLQ